MILQRSSDDLGSAGRPTVDQHDQGNVGGRTSTLHPESTLFRVTTCLVKHDAIAQKLAGDGDGRLDQAAAIVPQVQHQADDSCRAQFLDSGGNLVARPLGEGLDANIANVGCLVEHPPGDGWYLNLLPRDGEIERRGGGARNGESYWCAHLAVKEGAYAIHCCFYDDICAIQCQKDVSLNHSDPLGGGVGVGGEDHPALGITPQSDTYTPE